MSYMVQNVCALCVFLVLIFSCKPTSSTNPEISPTEGIDVVIVGMLKALEEDPKNATIWFQKANYLYERNQYDQALKDIDSAIKIDPKNIEFKHLKADIQLDYYQSREALTTLQDILKTEPNRIPTLLKLSEFQHILKDYQSSISTVNEIIRLQSFNAEAFFMLGMNFREIGELDKARSSFQRAVELDADLTDAWIILGNIYEADKNPIAKEYYDNAIRSNSESIEALHSKAFYLQNNQDVLGAIQLYRQINSLNPQYEDAYLNTGILYLSIDSLLQAKEHFKILSQINPANPFAFYYHGLTEEYLGNTESAQRMYKTAIRLKPDYGKAKEALTLLQKS